VGDDVLATAVELFLGFFILPPFGRPGCRLAKADSIVTFLYLFEEAIDQILDLRLATLKVPGRILPCPDLRLVQFLIVWILATTKVLHVLVEDELAPAVMAWQDPILPGVVLVAYAARYPRIASPLPNGILHTQLDFHYLSQHREEIRPDVGYGSSPGGGSDRFQ